MNQARQADTPSQVPPAPQGQTPDAPRPRGRRVWILLAVGLSVAVAGAAAWERTRGSSSSSLRGAVLTPPVQGFDFHLPDQDGHIVSLSDFRGKAVALAFLYTHCPDVCPLEADAMHQAYGQLGDVAARIALVAVSVDPAGDTPAAVRAFVQSHHVQGELTYLRGSLAQLRPVWSHYFVGSDATEAAPGVTSASSSSPAPQVGHTAIVYVIDPQGKIEAFLPANFDPQDLVTDLRLLAR